MPFTFLPNRPLVDGDTPYWECYHSDEGETFIDTVTSVAFFDGTSLSLPANLTFINDNGIISGISLEPYEAFAYNSTFLLGFPSKDRVAIKFGFDTGRNFSYDSSRDTLEYICHGLITGGNVSVSKTEGGAFGQLKFGQSYDRAE